MSFTVGQTVVHPHHGAAVINDLENRVFDGREMQYFVLTAPDTDLTLRVPTEACEDIGIRECMGREELDSLLTLLGEEGEPPKGHWSRRLKRNQERLRSGDPDQVAVVLPDRQGPRQRAVARRASPARPGPSDAAGRDVRDRRRRGRRRVDARRGPRPRVT